MNLAEARSLVAKLSQRYKLYQDLDALLEVAARYEGVQVEIEREYASLEEAQGKTAEAVEVQRSAQVEVENLERLRAEAERGYEVACNTLAAERAKLESLSKEVSREEKRFTALRPQIDGAESLLSTLKGEIEDLTAQRTAKREEARKEFEALAKRFSTDE